MTMNHVSRRRPRARAGKASRVLPARPGKAGHQRHRPRLRRRGVDGVPAHLGFRMVGVDVSLEKVRAIKEGRSPIVEERLGELLRRGRRRQACIDATQNLVAAVLDTDVTFMSVGTPTSPDGGCDLTYVRQASRAIGQALAMKSGYPRRRPALLGAAGHHARRRRAGDRGRLRQEARASTSASASIRNSCAKASPSPTSSRRRRP